MLQNQDIYYYAAFREIMDKITKISHEDSHREALQSIAWVEIQCLTFMDISATKIAVKM